MTQKATNLLTRFQVRAARALITWTQQRLAKEAEIAVSTVADFERGQRNPVAENVEAMRKALEKAGVTFLEGGAVVGPPPASPPQPTRNGIPIKWLTVTDLDQWADRRDSQQTLPDLINRLIRASAGAGVQVTFSADESVQRSGWDGTCLAASATEFVPSGHSGWELSTQQDGIKGKADGDYSKRTADAMPLDAAASTFVFVTLRSWDGKEKWQLDRRAEHKWADVRAYDADTLVHWIELFPAVGHWLAVKLGKRPPVGARQLDEAWEEWSLATKWALSTDLVLAGRDEDMIKVLEWLRDGPSVMDLQAESPQEAIAFLYAAIQPLPENYRLAYEARCLVAATDDAARAIGDSLWPLIIVLDGADPGLARRLAQRGHHVFVAHGSDAGAPDDVRRLPRPRREQIFQALKDMGLREEAAERLAHDCGRSLVILARLMEPGAPKPPWATNPPRALLAATLAGAWDEGNNDDKAILERLAGQRYEEITEQLTPLVGILESPIRRVGSTWKIASRQDAWFRLARYLTTGAFETFLVASTDVLKTLDPRFDLDPEERWYAGFKNIRPQYSGLLRHGLAETLILASLFGDRASGLTEPAARAAGVVTTILRSADEKGWWSLSHDLRLLAEASPDAYLSAVDETLRRENTPIKALFQEDGGVFGGEHLSDMLWALEMLAWNPQYLARATELLAMLDGIDKGGRFSNRPNNSLKSIFLLWLPQTYTPLEGRLRVLDRLRISYPDTAWKLMLALLPSGYDSISPSPHPHWRDYQIEEGETVTYGLIAEGSEAISRKLLEDVARDTRRWGSLIEILPDLDPKLRAETIAKLAAAENTITDQEHRGVIWAALRELLHNHRNIPEADWALPASELAEIERVYDRYAPADPVRRVAWLFAPHVNLPNPAGGDYDADEKALVRLRKEAVESLLKSQNFDALLALARNLDAAGFVGGAIAESSEKDKYLETVYARALRSTVKQEGDLAYGMIFTLSRREPTGWSEALVKRALDEHWGDEAVVRILIALPDGPDTWRLAASAGEQVEREFWSKVRTLWIDGDARQIEFAAEKLLGVGRARHAIELLGHNLKKQLPTSLLIKALRLAAQEGIPENSSGNDVTMFAYYAAEILKAIDTKGDASDDDLSSLEWSYLHVLRQSRRREPKSLYRRLATDPRFFVEVLSAVFSPAKESGVSEEPPADRERATALASHAYRLLRQWNLMPGTKADGTIDAEAMAQWVKAVRMRAKEVGRTKIADDQIGQAFAATPPERDGVWPAIAVRQVIETLRTDEFERGFLVGKRNLRGVTSRGLSDGGAQERAVAQQFRTWAKSMELEWHRTAALLERLAESYDEEARRHDDDAERNDW